MLNFTTIIVNILSSGYYALDLVTLQTSGKHLRDEIRFRLAPERFGFALTALNPFPEIQDDPTFYRPTEKTKVLNESFKQLLYKFYPQNVLILEECLLKW